MHTAHCVRILEHSSARAHTCSNRCSRYFTHITQLLPPSLRLALAFSPTLLVLYSSTSTCVIPVLAGKGNQKQRVPGRREKVTIFPCVHYACRTISFGAKLTNHSRQKMCEARRGQKEVQRGSILFATGLCPKSEAIEIRYHNIISLSLCNQFIKS
ncbi:hypothetical protein HOY80DRAFT_939456, partial [Tuber brumale]